jgi:hypothetical protein
MELLLMIHIIFRFFDASVLLFFSLKFLSRRLRSATCFTEILAAGRPPWSQELELILIQQCEQRCFVLRQEGLLSYRPQSPLQHLGQTARGCISDALNALAHGSTAHFNDLTCYLVIFGQYDQSRHNCL